MPCRRGFACRPTIGRALPDHPPPCVSTGPRCDRLGCCHGCFARTARDAEGRCLARVEAERTDGVRECYENTARGLEQGWEIAARTAGTAPLRLAMKVERAIALLHDGERPTSLVFVASRKRAAPYAELVVTDANGATVSAWFASRAGGFDDDVVVAAYPLAVAPLDSAPALSLVALGQSSRASAPSDTETHAS